MTTQHLSMLGQLKDLYEYDANRQGLNMLPYVAEHDAILQQEKRLNREELLKFQNRDAHTLLSSSNNKFWTVVFNDSSVIRFLDTYLKNAPRPFDTNLVLRDDTDDDEKDDISHIDKLESLLYRRVFMIFWRMVHDPIQKQRVIDSKISHGRIIYQCGLLDTPKLFDLCVLYGYSNTTATRRLLGRIFLLCPELFTEFASSLAVMQTQLNELIAKSSKMSASEKKSIASIFREVNDIVDFLYDITFTLRSSVEIIPIVSFAFDQLSSSASDVLSQLATIYEKVLHDLKAQLDKIVSGLNDDKDASEILSKQAETITFLIDQTRLNILAIFYQVLNECYLAPLLDLTEEDNEVVAFYNKYYKPLLVTNSEDNMSHVQLIYNMTKKKLPDTREALFAKLAKWFTVLFADPAASLSLATDLDKIYNLQQSIQDIADQDGDQKTKQSCTTLISKLTALKKKFGSSSQPAESEEEALDEDEAEQLVTLREIFPDFGDGFLLTCLDHYRGDSAKATDAILNEKLPKYLQKLDRKLPKRKSQTRFNVNSLVKEDHLLDVEHPPTPSTADIVSPTIWENTDLFTSGKVFIGKRKTGAKNEELGNLDEGLQQRIIENYLYDDEYDDSYDNVIQLGEDEVQSDREETVNDQTHAERPKKPTHTPKAPKDKDNQQPKGRGKVVQTNQTQPSQDQTGKPMGRGRGFFKPKTEASLPGTETPKTTVPLATTTATPVPTTTASSTPQAQQDTSSKPTTGPTSTGNRKNQNRSKDYEKKKRKQKADKKRVVKIN